MRGSDAGWFGPGSATWAINSEAALILGGGCALILQVAHPLVGAGVEHYSRFHRDRWRRLTHTLDTMGQLIFGDAATAEHGAARMRRAHARIQGVVSAGQAAGHPYDATDPALVLWVWATLVHTSIAAYERYVGPLPAAEIARYYEEQKRLAHACGVPVDGCPPTYTDFTAYFEATVERTLEPTAAARHVAALALNPLDLPAAAAPVLALVRLPTLGLLPDRLRDELDLRWSLGRARVFALTAFVCRRAIPLLPRRLRHVRSARAAARRVRAAPAVGPATPHGSLSPAGSARRGA
ncbi:MAG TPA: oxygenase MpaB family protein [Conexibacter sp.]|nr:oxygenase MpaB family protein [Conexibacter sp.]